MHAALTKWARLTATIQSPAHSRCPETLNLGDLERAALEKYLQVTSGSILAAAQLLGVGETTAQRKVKQYGLSSGAGAAFYPKCSRRLPRHNPSVAERVPPPSTATPAPVSLPTSGFSPALVSVHRSGPPKHLSATNRRVAGLQKDAPENWVSAPRPKAAPELAV